MFNQEDINGWLDLANKALAHSCHVANSNFRVISVEEISSVSNIMQSLLHDVAKLESKLNQTVVRYRDVTPLDEATNATAVVQKKLDDKSRKLVLQLEYTTDLRGINKALRSELNKAEDQIKRLKRWNHDAAQDI